MAGPYRMALPRARVEMRGPDGAETGTLTRVQCSLRDGVAVARSSSAEVLASMPVAHMAQSRRLYLLTGEDGSTWTVTKEGG